MSLIHTEQFNKIEKNTIAVHKSTIAAFTVLEDSGQKHFQIDTCSIAECLIQEKVSQPIQVDKLMVKMPIGFLQHEFSLD